MTNSTRKIPAKALCFTGGPFAFAAPPAPADEAGRQKAPIKMRARGGQPVPHWYWGLIAHDMAGFKASKPTIPIDYCHDDREIVGFLDKFTAGNDGLDVEGQIVSFQPDDRAAEVLYKGGQGVPYEASIFFDPDAMVLEDVPPGMSTQVNGYQLNGPALIVRQWSLRGVAVCPYGKDPTTSTQFTAGNGEVEVKYLNPQEAAMPPANPAPPAANSAPTTNTVPAAPPAAAPATPPADARTQFAAELKRYTDRFGAENGTKWFTEGKTYEAALELHIEQLTATGKDKDKKLAETEAKLAAAPRGESAPVSSGDAEKPAAGAAATKWAHLGENLAKVAGAIKLPGRK